MSVPDRGDQITSFVGYVSGARTLKEGWISLTINVPREHKYSALLTTDAVDAQMIFDVHERAYTDDDDIDFDALLDGL